MEPLTKSTPMRSLRRNHTNNLKSSRSQSPVLMAFIAFHIARRLKTEDHYIIASDWKKRGPMTEDVFCHESCLD